MQRFRRGSGGPSAAPAPPRDRGDTDPEDKERCPEMQSSRKSLHNTFPYKNQGAGLEATLDAPPARMKSGAATSPPPAAP